MNGLECERLAAGLLGVVVTLSTVSWLRNAIDGSYFYVIAWSPRRWSGTGRWAHGFTCCDSAFDGGGWCSNMNVRIIIMLGIWRLAKCLRVNLVLLRLIFTFHKSLCVKILSLFSRCITVRLKQ